MFVHENQLIGTVDLTCTLHELQSLLAVNTTKGFRMIMKLFHERDFIDGAIVLQDMCGAKTREKKDLQSEKDPHLSIKWFAYCHGNYLSRLNAFCMLNHIQIIPASNRSSSTRVLIQRMEPYTFTDFLYLAASKYDDTVEFNFTLVAEEDQDREHVFVMCYTTMTSSSLSSDIVEQSLAYKIMSERLNTLEHAIVSARISLQNFVTPEQWVRDAERLRCVLCTSAFSTFRRRHHCRLCGEVICNSCSGFHRAHINAIGLIKMRICVFCSKDRPRRQSSITRMPDTTKASHESTTMKE